MPTVDSLLYDIESHNINIDLLMKYLFVPRIT